MATLLASWDAVDDAIFDAYRISDVGRQHVQDVIRIYTQSDARERAIRAFLRDADVFDGEPDLFDSVQRKADLPRTGIQ
jgi:hypothetical protein